RSAGTRRRRRTGTRRSVRGSRPWQRNGSGNSAGAWRGWCSAGGAPAFTSCGRRRSATSYNRWKSRGIVAGPFGIHKDGSFCLVHVPTGCKLISLPKLGRCKSLARTLATFKINWKATVPEEVTGPDVDRLAVELSTVRRAVDPNKPHVVIAPVLAPPGRRGRSLQAHGSAAVCDLRHLVGVLAFRPGRRARLHGGRGAQAFRPGPRPGARVPDAISCSSR